MNEVSSRSHAIFTIHITVTFTTKLSHGGREGKGGGEEGDAEDDVRWERFRVLHRSMQFRRRLRLAVSI